MIGLTLGDRYEILEEVGQGGMATVYKAKCKLLNRYVAIKILKEEFIDDKNFMKKFKRESQAAASLSHPNILNVYDVGAETINEKNIPYIVMEFIEGKTLKQIIVERGRLTVDETIYYSRQIAEAIKHAHINNVIHRDIKPQNIMITKDNRVKVTDFGIARAASSSTLTVSSNVLGSVHYFSPEQARGGYTDETSDIYSLGITMYEMVTGKLPFTGENLVSVALKHVQEEAVSPRELNKDIPSQLEAIILKCIQKNQGDRYPSLSALITDLKGIELFGADIPEDNLNDESPTRIIPTEEIDNLVENSEEPLGKKKKKDNNMKVTLLAIGLAFLLVSTLFFGYFRLKGLFKVEEVTVPFILGMEEEEARQEIEDLGLEFKVVGLVKSEEFEPGQVASQSVEAGTKVRKGFTIEVTISEGQDMVRVPSLINKSLEEAQADLAELGLSIGTVSYRPSDVTPKDLIIKQEPEANTYLEPGSKINVIISEGEEIRKVIMPRLIGQNIIDAKNALLSLDLTIGDVIEQYSDSVETDKVIWQSIESGTELETKTKVDLYVSKGPEKKPDEQEPTEPEDDKDKGQEEKPEEEEEKDKDQDKDKDEEGEKD
ncbi:MAG TPA: Stk1 family PASTA domain-containing Ser/Thr kinase [Tissierellaceae bacterium]|nr:Stk1 family PASTA domain-containing Ser/Thr kinase [Tissierellaceae bacterium]